MRKLIIVTLTLAAATLFGAGTAVAQPEKHHHHHRHHAVLGPSVHQEMYMQLLADRYAPETSGEWRKVFEERKRLMEAVKGLDGAGRDSFRQEMKRKFHEGDEKMQDHMDTVKQFSRAVESGDEKQIKEVLPKMLAAEKQFNKMLAETLKKAGKK
ncbi:hypothetical protein [Paenibacillus alkalitolerans]|uniref:hypothetical protein n=1 Tax=Paenibacillus alkalitolerans TaxID=2799335 RepID=UPI0018F333ED|nr:hypothetical protein [Paenibacillus alkalitolerans]